MQTKLTAAVVVVSFITNAPLHISALYTYTGVLKICGPEAQTHVFNDITYENQPESISRLPPNFQSETYKVNSQL